MTSENNDFTTLLKDAPLAADPDALKVVGILGRTHDPDHFVLTIADGRSQTLPVEAVKSARKLAGAIGQSVVELDLDAKRLSDAARAFLQAGNLPFYPPGGGFKTPYDDGRSVIRKEAVETIVPPDAGVIQEAYYSGYLKAVSDPGGVSWPEPWRGAWPVRTGIPDIAAGLGAAPQATYAPFVAAMPHHVDPATIAALGGSGRRTYYSPTDWGNDPIQKPITDKPWSDRPY